MTGRAPCRRLVPPRRAARRGPPAGTGEDRWRFGV